MADIQSNININIDANEALASLRALQREISAFHQQMAKGGASAAATAAQMQQQLVNAVNATGKFSASMQTIKTTTESFTTALEKNKLSMGEYFRYGVAASGKFGSAFKTELDTVNKVARERVKDLQTQYIKMGRDANGAMKAIAVRPLSLDMENLGTKTAIAAQRQQIFNQLVKQGSTNLLNFGKNTQWAGRQLMVGFSLPLAAFGAMAGREFAKLEEQVVRFKRVYGDTFTSSAETDKMIGQIRDLATEYTKYGVAVDKTMSLAADAAAMGKQGADLVAQVAQASKLAVLGGVDQQKALETTTSLTNAFGVSAEQLAGKINFLNAVENQTVTSIDDLTTAIPTAGPVIQQLGGDVQDLAFFLTAMKEGGIDASEGANALKSGLASLINPTGEAVDMLAGFNINLKGIVEANKGDVKGTVIDFAKALDTLDPLNRARAIEQLFGKFQFARMSTLFQNVIQNGSQASRVLELTKSTTEELAVLSEREMKKMESSPLYQFQQAIEKFQAAMAPVGEAFMKAVTPIINFGTKLLDGFNGWSDQAKTFVVIFTSVVAGIGPVLLMAFGLVANGLANVIKLFQFLGGIFRGAGTGSKILGEELNYMTSEQLKAAAVAASLDQVHNTLTQTFTSEASAVSQLAAAYEKAAVASRGISTGMVAGGAKGRAPKKFAAGGILKGPGSGTSDSMLILASNGEAVIPADAVKRNPGLIKGLIAGRFARGGIVGDADFISQMSSRASNPAAVEAELRRQLDRIRAYEEKNNVQIADDFKVEMTKAMEGVANVTKSRITDALAPRGGNARLSEIHQMVSPGARSNAGNVFAHIGPGMVETPAQAMAAAKTRGYSPEALKLIQTTQKFAPDADIRLLHAWGARMGATENKELAMPRGSNIGGITKAFGGTAAASKTRWNQSLILGGFDPNDTQTLKELQNYDKAMSAKLKSLKAAGVKSIVDNESQIMALPEAERKMYRSLEALDREVISEIGSQNKRLVAVRDRALSTIRDVRVEVKSKESKARVAADPEASRTLGRRADGRISKNIDTKKPGGLGAFDPQTTSVVAKTKQRMRAEAQAELRWAEEYAATKGAGRTKLKKMQDTWIQEEANRIEDNIRATRNAKSAERRAIEKPVIPDGKGRISGALAKGAGRVAGFAGAASGIAMGASMLGGPVGEAAGQAMGPLMAITGVASLFTMMPPQIAAVTAAFGLVAVAGMSMYNSLQDARKAAAATTEATTASTTAMQKFAEFAGTVGPTELANKRAQLMAAPIGIQTGKETFGGAFFGTEEGTKMMDQVKASIGQMGAKTTMENLGNQLATAVASGILTNDQVKSIIANMGAQLGNYNFAIGVNAKVLELIGQDGKDLLKDPITVQAKIVAQTSEQLSGKNGALDYLKGLESQGTAQFTHMFDQGYWKQVAAGEQEAATYMSNLISQTDTFINKLDEEHQKRLDNAKAAGDLAAFEKEMADYPKQRADAIKQNSQEILKNIAEIDKMQGAYNKKSGGFTGAQNENVSAMVNASEASAKSAFAGKSNEASANAAIESIANAQGAFRGSTKLTILAEVQSGTITPETLQSLTRVLDPNNTKNQATYKVLADVTATYGGQAANQLATVLSMFDNTEAGQERARQLAINITAEGADTQGLLDTITKINQFSANDIVKIDLTDDKGLTDSVEQLDALKVKFEEISALGANGPIDLSADAVVNVIGADKMAGLLADKEYFDSLDPVSQVTYLQTYLTAYDEVTKEQADEYIKSHGGEFKGMYGKKGDPAKRRKLASQKLASQAANQITKAQNLSTPKDTGTPDTGPADTSGGGGGGQESSILDDLLRKLKQVQMATLDVTKGWAASRTALDNLFPGGASNSPFQGIEQQMRRLGAKEDLITMIAGMDPEEFKKRKDELFTFDGAGNIAGFRNSLLSIGAAMRSIALGDFQSKQQKAVNVMQDQTVAVRKLVAAGVSYADAYQIAADATMASAIAGEQNNAVIAETVKQYAEATKAAKLFAATQAVSSSNQATIDKKGIVDYLKKNMGTLTDAQVQAILGDTNLQQLVLNPNIDPQTLQDALTNAENAANLEIDVKKLTIGGLEEIFNDGFNKAMETFSVKEKEIEIAFKAKKDPFQQTIQNAQNLISDIQARPGGMDDLEADLTRIDEKERVINEKYQARQKALDAVKQANQQILNQQKAQLTLADALSQGDIAAAARAAQDMQVQRAADAAAQQQQLLDQQRQAEIDAATGQMGLTRAQIETQVRDLKQEIFNIEEAMLEPAQFAVSLLDRQEQKQKESLTVLGRSKDQWEKIKNTIDLARVNSTKYKDAIGLALDVVDDILDRWKEIEKPKTTVHTIVTNYVTGSGAGNIGASGDGGSGGGSGSGSNPSSTPTPAANPAGNTSTSSLKSRYASLRGAPISKVGPSAKVEVYKLYNTWANNMTSGAVYHNANQLGLALAKYGYNNGGLVPGYGPNKDSLLAKLTPGEFVIRRNAVENFGVDNLSSINKGTYDGGSVYNYSISVNAKSDANVNDIARTVIAQIKQVDAQRIRGNRF
jgi:TP901 family phage tail tape measure protein